MAPLWEFRTRSLFRMRLFMRRARNSIRSPVFGRGRDTLTILANRYGSDKGDKAHGRHCYAEIYDRSFSSKRLEPIAFVEIGLLHPWDTDGAATRAPSLQMWREYFPRARLFGFDIDDFSMVPSPTAPYSEVTWALAQTSAGWRAQFQRPSTS
jgi:hypothetical protein